MGKTVGTLVLALQILVSGSAVASVQVAVGEGLNDVIGYSEGALQGDLAPLYQCIFSRAGVEPDFIQVPLNRGLRYLDSGQISMVLPLAQSADRDRIGEFAGELFEVDYVFVSKRELPQISQASGLRYGVPRGFVGRQFIGEPDPKIEEVSQWSQLVAMLEFGRLDAIVLPALLVDDFFGARQVNVYEQPAGQLPMSMYLSRKNLEPDLVARVKLAVESCGSGDLVSDIVR